MPARRLPKTLPSWREVLATPEPELWYPLMIDPATPEGADAVQELMSRAETLFVHDTLDKQISDLISSRNPRRPLSEVETQREVEALLAGRALAEYGRWALFPWSRRLVRLLPPDEFTELRSDRNRNKLTRAEQAKLRKLKLALAGLSVGNAIATTLALEGVFGELRLADFDTLDLSNMNRIRCAVHHIGVNKAIISARQIFEQNPYANLVLYTDGVTPDNLGEFIDGDGESGRVDIVLDECDSLAIKIKLREEARARKLPVLMETSDRGMLDIERFDLEPDRPILHGMLGGMTSADIAKLPPEQRMGLILKIVGEETISARLAASLLEVGHTLKGLSQLGSDVTLGGATTTIAVRRLGLGMPLASGRVFIDVNSQLSDVKSPGGITHDAVRARKERELAQVRELVRYAAMAPSDGNNQPWRFTYSDGALQVLHDASRSGGPSHEPGRQLALIAIGAAIENITIAARARGRSAECELFPSARRPELVAEIQLGTLPGGPDEDPLFEQIGRRVTNRRFGTRTHLAPVHAQALTSAARDGGAKLQLCTDRALLDELGQILGEADRMRLLSPVLHAEAMAQVRWTEADAHASRDGLGLDVFASPADSITLNLMRSPMVSKLLRDVKGGDGLTRGAAAAVASSAALGLLTAPGSSPPALVRGGRALQQVWLTASALGLAVHPYNVLVNLFARVERFQGAGLDKHEVRAVAELRERFTRCFAVSLADAEILLFRLSYAEPPSARTLRRGVDEIFTADASPS